jgi:hypothetical protein
MTGGLIALGVIEDVQHEPSQSGIDDSSDMDLSSVDRTATCASPGPLLDLLGRGPSGSLALRSGEAYDSNEYSSDEDLEDNSGSDETLVADGEGNDFGSYLRDKDVTPVSDGEEDIEDANSGSLPHNRNDPIMVTDGEESDSDGDLHSDRDQSVETPSQNAGKTQPSRSSEESLDRQRQGAEAHAEIRQRVTKYMEREAQSDQVKAKTTIKRKIIDEQVEDFHSSKRCLMTPAEVTDV